MESTGIAYKSPRRGPASVAVHEQLERMLADPLFSHSKRYPNLLRYVVERTLDDDIADLKERTLGVAVFGREPAYDTSTDPVVRATAGEIRKRIAQYYQEPGHEREIRISLSPGSYVPEFHNPPIYAAPAVSDTPSVAPIPPIAAVSRAKYWQAAAVVAAIALLTGILFEKPWSQRSVQARFWLPVLESRDPVLICIGQRRFAATSTEWPNEENADIDRIRKGMEKNPGAPVSLYRLYYMGSQNIALPDVVALDAITGLLQSTGKAYQVRGENSTSFSDLRGGPVILIGALNNDWTMRLTGTLRFNFKRDDDIFWIQDRRKPTARNRSVDYSIPYLKLDEDYAVISRVFEPITERMVVVAAGLTGYGTMAAGEFLSNPRYMEAAIQNAPKDWSRRNIQFVIATKVIDGNSGPPHVVDQYFW